MTIETLASMGFASPLEAVLSGQFELCVPMGFHATNYDGSNPLMHYNWSRAFVRNACFKVDGQWSNVVSVPVSEDEANQIKSHECVVMGKRAALLHLHTRGFPVKPDVTTNSHPG